MSKEKENLFAEITDDMLELYHRKNADYGDAFKKLFDKFGLDYTVIRLTEKLSRLESLTQNKGERKVKDESIEDTLIDLANYAIMSVIEMRLEKKYNKSETSEVYNGEIIIDSIENIKNAISLTKDEWYKHYPHFETVPVSKSA